MPCEHKGGEAWCKLSGANKPVGTAYRQEYCDSNNVEKQSECAKKRSEEKEAQP